MGLFSWDCAICGHPMLSKPATNKVNAWMKSVVVFVKGKKTSVMRGEYDGYGRAGGSGWDDDESNICDLHDPCCYHRACWEAVGKPGYTVASRSSADQGWFFDDPLHDMVKPETKNDLPAKPVEYTCATWREGLGRFFHEMGPDGKEIYMHIHCGPDRPMTLKTEQRLMLSRLFAKVARKHKHGHKVPAFHELEVAAARLISDAC
jgi:hypothetical protein